MEETHPMLEELVLAAQKASSGILDDLLEDCRWTLKYRKRKAWKKKTACGLGSLWSLKMEHVGELKERNDLCAR